MFKLLPFIRISPKLVVAWIWLGTILSYVRYSRQSSSVRCATSYQVHYFIMATVLILCLCCCSWKSRTGLQSCDWMVVRKKKKERNEKKRNMFYFWIYISREWDGGEKRYISYKTWKSLESQSLFWNSLCSVAVETGRNLELLVRFLKTTRRSWDSHQEQEAQK